MAIDPICGMTVDPATAAGSHEYKGQRYYFCSSSCLERFKADPERALTRSSPSLLTVPSSKKPLPMMMPLSGTEQAGEIDPVCGMTVQPATAAGSYDYRGKTYYFDSDECKDQFQKNPGKFLQEAAEGTPAEKAPSPKGPGKQQGHDHRHG